MGLQDIKKRFETGVQKQHDHRHLPRTRVVAILNERLEFILPPGVDAPTFCRGTQILDPEAHQIVAPQQRAALQSVIANFETGTVVFVYPETLLSPG